MFTNNPNGRPTTDPKTVSVTVRINVETKNRLEQISERTGEAISHIIRKLIEDGLKIH